MECEDLVRDRDLAGLLEWLNAGAGNVDKFKAFLTENPYSSAHFICEHTYFVYFGRVKKSLNLFGDEGMDEVAGSLGSGAIYRDGVTSGVEQEYVQVAGYTRPPNFFDMYQDACLRVDEDLAFSSVIQILKHSGEDLPAILRILTAVIGRFERGVSSLITNSLISILAFVDENRAVYLEAVLQFVESMWLKRDEQDSHAVGPSSLKVFCCSILKDMVSRRIKVLGSNGLYLEPVEESCLRISNLVAKFEGNLLRWVSSLPLLHSAPVAGPLDNVPVNEALCLYFLLISSRGLVPRVYTLRSMGLMLLKIAHLLLANKEGVEWKGELSRMAIECTEVGITRLEKYTMDSGDEVIVDLNMSPWHPLGFLTVLLEGAEEDSETDSIPVVVARILALSEFGVKVQLLKGLLKSTSGQLGKSVCLLECKNLSVEFLVKEGADEGHMGFVRWVLDLYSANEKLRELGDSTWDSLSLVLNWIKFLLLCKSSSSFKKLVSERYLVFLEDLGQKLGGEGEGLEASGQPAHIPQVLANKVELIRMLLGEVIALASGDD